MDDDGPAGAAASATLCSFSMGQAIPYDGEATLLLVPSKEANGGNRR